VQTIAELIRERSEVDGDRAFLLFEDDSITFSQLASRVDEWVSRLRGLGVRFGSMVALMLKNHPEHVYIYCAIAKLGAVHLPVSIHLKHRGLELQLADARPEFVVAEREFEPELRTALSAAGLSPCLFWRNRTPNSVNWTSDPQFSQASSAPRWGPARDNLDRVATLSYTSGTTGNPKGALLTERYLQHGVGSVRSLARVERDDVLFLWEPFYHLAAWNTVLTVLNVGCAMALVEKFSASRCWGQIRYFGATKLHYLGAVMGLLLKQPERSDDADNPVTIAWGAAAPTLQWTEFERRFGVEIREGYGMTEASAFTMLNLDGPIGSIGKPISSFRAWIERPDGQRAQSGETGEIVLEPLDRKVIMVGYYNNDEATNRLVRGGTLHTGDLGYQDGDGYFFFVGRATDSVRRRGENVSAWEVERVVREHPEVIECAIIGVPSDLGEEDIKLFVQTAPDSELVAPELLAWCRDRLAYYQVPRYVEFVSTFPYGGTHRIMKRQLSRQLSGPEIFDGGSLSRR
jgi:Acyl-CoA synthetases (AMP-forming)/AMP-acid ligases II